MISLLSVAALLLGSCEPSGVVVPVTDVEYSNVPVTVSAAVQLPDEVADVLWQADDVLKMRLSGGVYTSDTDCETLVSSEGGSTVGSVTCEGVLPSYRSGDNAYIYHVGGGEFIEGTGYRSWIPAEQTGRLEDIKDSLLSFAWVRHDSVLGIEDGQELSKVEVECGMSPMFALLKLNIPEALGARDITLEADAPLAGSMKVRPQRGWGTVGMGGLLDREGADSLGWTSVISIASDAETVGGNIYIAVLPDEYDKLNDVYCSSLRSLRLHCAYCEGDDYNHRFTFTDNLLCGQIRDLGQLPMPKPKVPVEGGSLCLMSNTTLTVAVKDANPDCEYYYELGTSEEDCLKPTVKSVRIDNPAEGFSPEISGTSDRYFIKVLAHALDNDHSDVVLTASLRNWSFNNGCPAGVILSDAFAGNSLKNKGDEVQTSDGLLLKRMQDYKEGDLKFEQTSSRIALVSAKVAMYMPVENDSQVTLWFCIDQRTCIGSGQRAFNLYYNENMSRINELNGNPVKTIVKGAETSGKKAILWPLGELNAGDRVAPAGDGQHVLYSMALFECL